MIARLRGEVLEVGAGQAVIDASGVGYLVQMPESVLAHLPKVGEHADLYVRQIVREDDISLYGFLDAHSRRMFDLLREVKGCGPKTGLALIGQLGEPAVAGAILSQDARALARANGVGPRLAERIILELKDKIQEDALSRKVAAVQMATSSRLVADDDLVDALLQLGYRRPEAEAAAATAREQADDLGEQLKLAIRSLAR